MEGVLWKASQRDRSVEVGLGGVALPSASTWRSWKACPRFKSSSEPPCA